jgi:ATP citrate (pro-S)-lyase
MSAKGIHEAKGKQLLSKYLGQTVAPINVARYDGSISWDLVTAANPWMLTQKLVAKPDQLIKRRGKLGLIKVNADLNEVKKWVSEQLSKEIQVRPHSLTPKKKN